MERVTQVRWKDLMHSMNLPESMSTYASLVGAYQQKHRYYHTVEHINAMLGHFDSCSNTSGYPCELELSIWFHDAIYAPFSSTNEVDSAAWAERFLREHQYDENATQRVSRMILATRHDHTDNTEETQEHHDTQLLVDIDLSILGTTPEVYDRYETLIRKEYRRVPSFIYKRKRRALLESFLAKPKIYQTPTFEDRYEKSARLNLSRAIKALS